MTAGSIPTVFVVEHDHALLATIEQLIQTLEFDARCFDSAGKLFEVFDPERPGCLVLEAQLPDESGLDVHQRLLAQGCQTPVIFVAQSADVSTVVTAMRAGAVDFLEQAQWDERLPGCIRIAVDQDRQRRQILEAQQHTLARLALLTPQERQVADCMTAGLSIKEIAARLDISLRTVHLRQAAILTKLELESTADLLLWMLRDVAHQIR